MCSQSSLALARCDILGLVVIGYNDIFQLVSNYVYSWIGRPIPSRQKNIFLTNQRGGYDKSETADEKLSARRI